MLEEIGNQIGDTIREVIECDVWSDRTGWGKVLQVYINMDLSKQISRGRIVNVDDVSQCL